MIGHRVLLGESRLRREPAGSDRCGPPNRINPRVFAAIGATGGGATARAQIHRANPGSRAEVSGSSGRANPDEQTTPICFSIMSW